MLGKNSATSDLSSSTRDPRAPWIRKESALKGGISGLCLIVVILLKLLVPGEQAGDWIVHTGYYFIALNFLLFLYCSRHLWTGKANSAWAKRHAPGLIICLLVTIGIHAIEPHRFKVLNDEFALLNNSMSMHYYKKAGLMGQAHNIDGQLVHSLFSADKRSLSFPFILSLTHSLSGYRPDNVFILNMLVSLLFMIVLYFFLRTILHEKALSLAGLMLAASIPLLHQVATSGGYDLMNTTFILAFILTAVNYLKAPSINKQSALVMFTLLLAQVRYESILYLLSLAAIVSIVWWREKQISLSWISVASPLFLFIPFMTNNHMLAHEALQDAKVRDAGEAFMSLDYLGNNLMEAARYFFLPGASQTNSVLLSILCAGGFFFVVISAVRNFKQFIHPSPECRVALLLTLPVTILGFLVMTMNFWGVLTDPQAARFALPIYILGLVCALLLLDFFLSNRAGKIAILAGSSLLLLGTAIPRASQADALHSPIHSPYHHWVLEFAEKPDPKTTLFTCDGILGLISHQYAAVPIGAVNLRPNDIAALVKSGLYKSIYAFELLVYDLKKDRWIHPPTHRGLDKKQYSFEIVAEKQTRDKILFRAYKLKGIKSSDGESILFSQTQDTKAPNELIH